MPAGRPKTSGKSHNKASKTYASALRNQPSTTSSNSSKPKSLDCYFKRPLKDTGDVALQPPTSVQRIVIIDETTAENVVTVDTSDSSYFSTAS